ncbi:jg10640 [Pararge aegeria aegeria]|uniref:Jg10640 protein n=1 Tax=Pararge aegeria aegeria TaxID=348720 RepID=A0A8S4RAG5_9NEOP|nr:jg10640 [Pararge aegeria aegeria]
MRRTIRTIKCESAECFQDGAACAGMSVGHAARRHRRVLATGRAVLAQERRRVLVPHPHGSAAVSSNGDNYIRKPKTKATRVPNAPWSKKKPTTNLAGCSSCYHHLTFSFENILKATWLEQLFTAKLYDDADI